MSLQRHGCNVFFAPVLEQRRDFARIVDLYSLLRRGRVVARRCGLEDQAVRGGEDHKLAHQARHLDRMWVTSNEGLKYHGREDMHVPGSFA